ncbi:MAG: glycine--tRNA ligase subunit alpha, partial [Hyphomicrobiaceae bacterium]
MSPNAQTASKTVAAPPFGALQPKKSFQDLILTLQQFWGAQGCVILQ